ncbi:hypothetical protein IHE44_0013405 [Lamprotornis superbus]|uniref:HORMA domain-containing protein n=1 Tax=Lamprotornis superbus TaxID=245042 RepID=A0A835NFH1_9PASS|nr:hypothetical protein IHE44_0013405 [Lamprotornis superbus]
MAAQQQLGREHQGITLRGSAELVAEFFSYGINSILYQRGIYPPETFTRVQKYGLTLLVTTDPELANYLNNVTEQMKEKSQKAIQDEIRSVIRQITATVTFLPLLESACAFDLLIYTDKDLAVPEKWEESGPQFIANSEEVRLRSFTTTIHKVNTTNKASSLCSMRLSRVSSRRLRHESRTKVSRRLNWICFPFCCYRQKENQCYNTKVLSDSEIPGQQRQLSSAAVSYMWLQTPDHH